MKTNLKTKVMLAVLAGGMLCANGAWADTSSGVTISGGKSGTPYQPTSTTSYTGTVGGDPTGTYAYTGGNVLIGTGEGSFGYDYIAAGRASEGHDEVTGNALTVSGGTINATALYGGNSTGAGKINGNTITVTGGTVNSAVYGGSGGSETSGNNVLISGGTINGYVYGGNNASGTANNNIVEITGGIIKKSVYGANTGTTGGTACNNIVTIDGGTFEGNQVYFYGGRAGNTGTSSGNTLNIKKKVNGKIANVSYFQIINFTLPADITAGEKMLSVKNIAFDGTKTTVNVDASATNLNDGDVITLIASDNAPTGVWSAGTVTGTDGTITLDGKNLIFTVGASGGDAATTKAIAEGIAASVAFVNQGADMVSGSGIDALYTADSENPAIAAFMGSKNRYNTGSHVDIHGWNALAGVALNNKASFSHGVFVEIGNADIDTYAALDGTGSSDYKGGGYMLRKDMGKGWSIDGSVRAGRVETSWGNDTKGGYEAKQTYYGAHVNFNKMLKEYNAGKLNGYLRYTFTHLGSDSVNLDGVNYGFDSVNNHRTRLGVRMVDEGTNDFALYYGAAWEYGFGGDCDATVNGVTTSGPAVDGSNGVFEVGGTWSDNKWEISAGLEAYAGAKRGVAGGMNFVYKF